jgi:hypothetical protein
MITETPTEHAFTGVQAAPPNVAEQAAPRRRGRAKLLLSAALATLLIAALAASAFAANLSLSNTYSPRTAVLAYFAAQQRHDVNGMLANADILRGEGSFDAYSDKAALTAMMQLPANSDLKQVRVLSVKQVSASDAMVQVSLTWNGTPRTLTFSVRKDPKQSHWLFYNSWKLQIPYATLRVALPHQAGPIEVDGVSLPSGGSAGKIVLIQGVHRVTMDSTDLLQSASQDVDVFDTESVSLSGTMNSTARAKVAQAVLAAFLDCDPNQYLDCIDHTYNAPDNQHRWYIPTAYGNVFFTSYKFTLTTDPTNDMKVSIGADPGKVSVSGACGETLTVDGGQTYNFKGHLDGTLTWSNGSFDSDLNWNCVEQKA